MSLAREPRSGGRQHTRHANVLGGAVLGVAVFIVYAWSGHVWIDVVDEGYFLDLADRVRLGALPYRDFATYYTPGIFYLFAAVMNVFGASVLPIRYVMAGLRAAAAVLMFGLTRRVAPWPWALVPVVVLLALDHWPIEPEPHPSWPAIVACLASLELVARHHGSGKLRWLGLAGALAGVSFLFKQNDGAFTVLGVAGYVVLRPQGCGRVLRGTQVLFAMALGGVVSAFLSPGLDGWSVLALWLPVLLAVGVTTWLALLGGGTLSQSGRAGRAQMILEAIAAAAGFGLVTLSWLVPLALVLGLPDVPLELFLGAVDPSGLAIGFEAPTLDRLHLYLPALAAWAGLAALALTRTRGLQTWYILFGALALLAMYPRSDTAHALVAAPPILVAGAWALSRVRPRLLGVALLSVPLVAVVPQVAWRADLLLEAPYAPLGLARADVLVPRTTAAGTRAVVDFVQTNTPAGAPLFVYPAAPLLNFLAERPNPTRFDHFFPGTLSQDDLVATIDELEQARPRYVIWDHRGVIFWGTDPANRLLSDYLWTCYSEVAAFDLYLVLERSADGC